MPRKLPTIESTIESVLKAGRGYPEPQWLADYRGITPQEAYEAIKGHSENTNWGALAMERPKLPESPGPLSHKAKLPYGNKSNIEHFHDLPKGILKVLFGVVSILAGIRSWGFIYSWFAQWDAGFFSAIMATILTVAMIALPQAAIIFKRERRWFMMAVSIFLIAVSMAFSMVTTVAGLYNDRSNSLHAYSIANASNKAAMERIAALERQGQQAASDKKIDSDELVTLQSKLKGFAADDVGSYEYNRVVNRIDNLKKRVDGYTNTIAMIQERITSNLNDKQYVIQRDDFFTYIEGVTKVPRAESEFGISVIVSIIVDIAGPVFATICLFL